MRAGRLAWTGLKLPVLLLLACAPNGSAEGAVDLGAPEPARSAAPADARNLLLLVSDDQRADALGVRGNALVETPHIDSLAASGFSFTSAYCMGSTVAAVCAPSRAMLLSGKSLFRFEGSIYDQADPDPILPEWLRLAGWVTHGTGKWHNGRLWFHRAFERGDAIFHGGMGPHRELPVHHFDPSGRYDNAERYATATFSSEEFADSTLAFLEWLKQRAPAEDARPFCAYIAFTAPHDPRTPPGDFRAMYDPDEVPVPASFLPVHPFDNGDMTVRDELLAPWPRMLEVVQQHIADYYGMISHMDAQIGRILAALDRHGLRDETLIVFLSDHGLSIGGHGLMGKQNLYDEAMRAPLILSGPGVPQGESDALVYLFDVYPTVCELLGLEPPPGEIDGRSLVPLLRGEQTAVRDAIFSAYLNVQRAVRDERWKLIEYPRVRITQLFDLERDPDEVVDLASDPAHKERVRALRARLAELQAAFGDPLAKSR